MKLKLADILRPIEPFLAKVDDEIKKQLLAGIPVLDESAMHLFAGGGKKIRASLIILSSGLSAPPSDDVIELAAAAEIIHCASLIHDDIIDQSELRRGLPTVSRKWGSRIAVLAGDYMYTRALGVAVDERRRDIFPTLVAATSDMVKGELYQIEYSRPDRISKKHYFTIIELKTARFMAACMKLGAVKGGMTPAEAEVLYNAGLNLGFAFQIVDDTLDVMDDATLTGKDAGNDFMEGKITLPFLHLLESVTDTERAGLIRDAGNPDAENWKKVRARIMESGAVRYCLDTAGEYTARMMECLETLPPSEYKSIIVELSKFLVERNF